MNNNIQVFEIPTDHICTNNGCGRKFETQKGLNTHKRSCNGKMLQKAISEQKKIREEELRVTFVVALPVVASVREQITVSIEVEEEVALSPVVASVHEVINYLS